MNTMSSRLLLITMSFLITSLAYATQGYSNNSRGPYHHVYSHPINNSNSQEVIPEVLVIDAEESFKLNSELSEPIKLSSSSTRSSYSSNYSNIEAGGCFADLDYNGSVDDTVSKRTRVLCQDKLSSKLVRRIQGSLSSRGFGNVPATGELDTRTLGALYSFQVSRSLPAGAVTKDTLNSLGINSL